MGGAEEGPGFTKGAALGRGGAITLGGCTTTGAGASPGTGGATTTGGGTSTGVDSTVGAPVSAAAEPLTTKFGVLLELVPGSIAGAAASGAIGACVRLGHRAPETRDAPQQMEAHTPYHQLIEI